MALQPPNMFPAPTEEMPSISIILLIVYVSLKDARGTGCFGENGQQVKLEVTAGGELRSPQQVNTEAGVASFLVATGNASTLTLKATCGQLTATRKLKLK